VDLARLGGELICQKDAFLCAAYGTRIGISFSKRIGAGFFGGEGFILQRLQGDGLDPADTQYLAQLIARETGMSPAEAQARVTDVQTRMRAALEKARNTAKQAADDARKATAYAALWLFITLLIGAFFASLSATWGGRRRDL